LTGVLPIANGGSGAATLATTPWLIKTGVTDGSNAAAGQIGEYASSNKAFAARTGVITATPSNVTTLSLTAGDWDVGGNVWFQCSAFASNQFIVGISTTSVNMGDQSVQSAVLTSTGILASCGLVAANQRLSLSSTTTVYLVGRADFGSGTVEVCGLLWARRVR
jgi:hypothetical protein